MREKWKTYKLGEICDDVAMGPFGSNLKVDNFIDKGVPVIRGMNLNDGGFTNNSFAFVSEEKANSLKRCLAYPDDLVFTHRGTLGQVAIIPKNGYEKYLVSQSQMRLTVNKKYLAPKYLYYFFKSPLGQKELLKNSSQVGVPAIANPTKSLKEVEITIPDLKTQNELASILSSLDDKIELTLQMNQTLEAMAQAIFKEWFVNFNFPDFDGELVDGLPKGWKEVPLENVVELIIDHRGKTPIKLGGDWVEVGIPAISAKNVKDGKLVNIEDVGYVSEEMFNKWMKDKLHPFDILLTSEGPLGEVAVLISNINYCLSQRLFAIRVNSSCRSSYLYYYLRSETGKSNIQKRATGSTVLGIRQSELRRVETILPSIEVQNMFDETVSSFLLKMDENFNEIRTLTSIRDSLLPKLMSGKIEVKE